MNWTGSRDNGTIVLSVDGYFLLSTPKAEGVGVPIRDMVVKPKSPVLKYRLVYQHVYQ